jgi:hypothetical protein
MRQVKGHFLVKREGRVGRFCTGVRGALRFEPLVALIDMSFRKQVSTCEKTRARIQHAIDNLRDMFSIARCKPLHQFVKQTAKDGARVKKRDNTADRKGDSVEVNQLLRVIERVYAMFFNS